MFSQSRVFAIFIAGVDQRSDIERLQRRFFL
jgi:hypothetical protein